MPFNLICQEKIFQRDLKTVIVSVGEHSVLPPVKPCKDGSTLCSPTKCFFATQNYYIHRR